MDLTFAFYNPTFGCTFTCCIAVANSPCGTVSIANGSLTSNNLEQGRFLDTQAAAGGGFYSYLVYVKVESPTSPTELKLSNAQINVFQRDNQDPTVFYSLTAQNPQTLPIPFYWVVACMKVSNTQVITFKDLKNGTYSTFTVTQPQPINYCS